MDSQEKQLGKLLLELLLEAELEGCWALQLVVEMQERVKVLELEQLLVALQAGTLGRPREARLEQPQAGSGRTRV